MLKRIPLFCQETGYSEKAVVRKIEDGVSAGGEWCFISGVPGWHANQEYRQCE